jgi:phage tail sheath protein FI
MPRPQVTVNVTSALPRRGAPSTTGTAFMVTSAGTGPTAPVRLNSLADAQAAFGAIPFATWAGDALAEGVPEVVAVRATGALVDLTAAEWTAALDKFTTAEFGPGQVTIPGVATAAAHDALISHQAATGRAVFLDGDDTPTAAELLALATAQAADAGAKVGSIFAPWVPYDSTDRLVPASVLAAALAARGDARVGHTNHAPAGTHSGGAGVLRRANKILTTFSDADWDDLADAGVNLFVNTPQGPALYGWNALTTDPQFAQLNHGRMVMKITAEVDDVVRGFLFRQIDGQGHLYAEVEGALRGYLDPLYRAGALFGAEASDAYDVEVAEVNTEADAAAGILRAAIAVRFSSHTEQIVIDVVTHLADGTV